MLVTGPALEPVQAAPAKKPAAKAKQAAKAKNNQKQTASKKQGSKKSAKDVKQNAKSKPAKAQARAARGHQAQRQGRDGVEDDGMLFAQDAENAKRERDDIQKRLSQLRQDIAAGEQVKNEARDQLRSSEQAISEGKLRLAELADQDRLAAQQLSSLQSQQTELSGQMLKRQEQLANLLHKQYVSGGSHPVKAFLSGKNPNESARQLSYLGYVANAQANLVSALRSDVQTLNQLQTNTRAKRDEVTQIAKAKEGEQQELEKQAQERKRVLETVSAQIQAQRKQAQTLERDQERLGNLVDRISKMIAQRKALAQREQMQREQAQREAQAKAREAKEAREARMAEKEAARESKNENKGEGKEPREAKPAPTLAKVEAAADPGFEARLEGNFEKRKGSMRLPVRGDITARFGSPRTDGGPPWKGVFIRAAQGAPVNAVAAGRVVYAEYMRGFGNLILVDHGSQFLTIYGNNQALLKRAGDTVRAGETIATVGDTGGNPESGVYFELRRNGQSVDPMAWASLK